DGVWTCDDNEDPAVMCMANGVLAKLTASDVAGVQRAFCDAAPAACDEHIASGFSNPGGSLNVLFRDADNTLTQITFDGVSWTPKTKFANDNLVGDAAYVRSNDGIAAYGVLRQNDYSRYAGSGTQMMDDWIAPTPRQAYYPGRHPFGGVSARPIASGG